MNEINQDISSRGELKRHLTFRDVFFLSFGGMSPLLSLLTYGAVALSYGGPLSPLIMIIGTMLVLINGLVVMQLSKRFKTSGGYYTYAFQVLSERVGFSTGWIYLFYSILFGLAYVMGAVYVLVTVLAFPIYPTFLTIVLPASLFLIFGIKPSAKYAIYTGIAEIGIILAIVFLSFYLTAGAAYIPDPVTYYISGGALALGILFAMGIPTGYGAIAPLSGEIKNPEKVVGRSAVAVILVGGTFASLFIYAMSNLIIHFNLGNLLTASKLPILSILSDHFSIFSRYTTLAVSIAAINDGILAILSFGAAASRTMFRMGYDRTFPNIFARKFKDQPIVSNIATASIIVIVPLLLMSFVSIADSFVILGTVASLGGLFIHIMAGSSLLRVGMRRGKRLLLRTSRSIRNVLIDYKEVFLAGTAVIMTSVELIYSAFSTLLIYSTFFLLWIVVGYIIVDIRDIVMRTPYSVRLTKGEISVAEKMKDLTSLKIRNALPDVVVRIDDTVETAINRCVSLDSPGAVVVDSRSIPVGTLIMRDALLLTRNDMIRMRVKDLWLEKPVLIGKDSDLTDVIRSFKESRLPILSIVDEKGVFSGTVREREVVLSLGGFGQEKAVEDMAQSSG